MSVKTLNVASHGLTPVTLQIVGPCICRVAAAAGPKSALCAHSRHVLDILKGEPTLQALACLTVAVAKARDLESIARLRQLISGRLSGTKRGADELDEGDSTVEAMRKKARILADGVRLLDDMLSDLSDIATLERAIPTPDEPSLQIAEVVGTIKAFFDRAATVRGLVRGGAGIVVRTADSGAIAVNAARNIYKRNIYTPTANGDFEYSLRSADERGRSLVPGDNPPVPLTEELVYAAITESLRDTPDILELGVYYTLGIDLSFLPTELAASFDAASGENGVVAVERNFQPENFSDSFASTNVGREGAPGNAIEALLQLEAGRGTLERDDMALRVVEMFETASLATVRITPTGTKSSRLYRLKRRAATADDDKKDDNDEESQLVVTLNLQPSTMEAMLADMLPRQLFEAGLPQSPEAVLATDGGGAGGFDDDDEDEDGDSYQMLVLVLRARRDFADVTLGRDIRLRVSHGNDRSPPTLRFSFPSASEVSAMAVDVSDVAEMRDAAVLSNGFVRDDSGRVYERPPRVEVDAATLVATQAEPDQIIGPAPATEPELSPSGTKLAFMKAEVAVDNMRALIETETLTTDTLRAQMQMFLDAVDSNAFKDRAHLRVTRGKDRKVVFFWQSSKDAPQLLYDYYTGDFFPLLASQAAPLPEFEFMAYETNGADASQAEFTSAQMGDSPLFRTRFVDEPRLKWVSMRSDTYKVLAPSYPAGGTESDPVAEFVVRDIKYATLMQFAAASRFAGMPRVQANFYKPLASGDGTSEASEDQRILKTTTMALELVRTNGVLLDRQAFSVEELSGALKARVLQNPWLWRRVAELLDTTDRRAEFRLVPYQLLRTHPYLPSTTMISAEARLSGDRDAFSRIVRELRVAMDAYADVGINDSAVFPAPDPQRLEDASKASRGIVGKIFVRVLVGKQEPRKVLHETQPYDALKGAAASIEWASESAREQARRRIAPKSGTAVVFDARNRLVLGKQLSGLPLGAAPSGIPEMWFEVLRVDAPDKLVTLFRSRESLRNVYEVAPAPDALRPVTVYVQGEPQRGGGGADKLPVMSIDLLRSPEADVVLLSSFSIDLGGSALPAASTAPLVTPEDVGNLISAPPSRERQLVKEKVLAKLEVSEESLRKERKMPAPMLDLTDDSDDDDATPAVEVKKEANARGKHVQRLFFDESDEDDDDFDAASEDDEDDYNDDAKVDEQREIAQEQQLDATDDMALDVDGNGVPDKEVDDESIDLDADEVDELSGIVAALAIPAPLTSGIIAKPVEIEISEHDLEMPTKSSRAGFVPHDAKKPRIKTAVFLHPGWPEVREGAGTGDSPQLAAHILRINEDWPELLVAPDDPDLPLEPVEAGFIFEGQYYRTFTHALLVQTLEFFGVTDPTITKQLRDAKSDGDAAQVYNDAVSLSIDEVGGFEERFKAANEGRDLCKNGQFMEVLADMQRARLLQNPRIYRSALALLSDALEKSDQAHLHLLPSAGTGIDKTVRTGQLAAAAIFDALSDNYIREPPFLEADGGNAAYTSTRRLIISERPLASSRIKPVLAHVRVAGIGAFTDAFFKRTSVLKVVNTLLSPLVVGAAGGAKKAAVDEAANKARAILFQEGIVSLDFTVLYNRAGEVAGASVAAFVDDRDRASHRYKLLGLQVLGQSAPVINRLLSHAEYNMLNSGFQNSSGRSRSTLAGLVVPRAAFVQEARPATLIVTRDILVERNFEAQGEGTDEQFVLAPGDENPKLELAASTHYGRTFAGWLVAEVFARFRWNLDGRFFPLVRDGRLVLEEVKADDGATVTEFRRVDIWRAAPHPYFIAELPSPKELSLAYPSVRAAPGGKIDAVPQPCTFLSIECHAVSADGEFEKLLFRSNHAPDWVKLNGEVALLPFENEARRFLAENRELYDNRTIDKDLELTAGTKISALEALEDGLAEVETELATLGDSERDVRRREKLAAEKRTFSQELREIREGVARINDSDERRALVDTLNSDPLRFADWDPNLLVMNDARVSVDGPDISVALGSPAEATLGELHAKWADTANWTDTVYPDASGDTSVALRQTDPFVGKEEALDRLSSARLATVRAVNRQRWLDLFDKYKPPQPYTKLQSMLVFDVDAAMQVVFTVVERTLVGGTVLSQPRVVFRAEKFNTGALFNQTVRFTKALRMPRRYNEDGDIEFVDEEAQAADGTPLIQAEGDQAIRTSKLANVMAAAEPNEPETLLVDVSPEGFGTDRRYEVTLSDQNRVTSLRIEFNNNMEVLDDQPQRVAIGAFFIKTDTKNFASSNTIKDVTAGMMMNPPPTSSTPSRRKGTPKRRIILK